MMTPIPTNIITGFLGAGKTTAILSLLARKPSNEKWAILINEFGNVGIDGAILSQGDAIVKEVAGGCMCCTSGLPMSVGINALLAQKPDRLLIEPTGLGHPKEIINQLTSETFANYIDLHATITLVDPRQFSDSNYTQNDNFQDQLALADVLVANKLDQCQPNDILAFENYYQNCTSEKLIIGQVEQGELDIEWLSAQRIERSAQHSHHHHGQTPLPSFELAPGQQFVRKENKGQGYVSCGWIFAADQVFDFSLLFKLFSNVNAQRVKAVVHTERGYYVFNVVNRIISVDELSLEDLESKIEVIDQQALPWDDLEHLLCSLVTSKN